MKNEHAHKKTRLSVFLAALATFFAFGWYIDSIIYPIESEPMEGCGDDGEDADSCQPPERVRRQLEAYYKPAIQDAVECH